MNAPTAAQGDMAVIPGTLSSSSPTVRAAAEAAVGGGGGGVGGVHQGTLLNVVKSIFPEHGMMFVKMYKVIFNLFYF